MRRFEGKVVIVTGGGNGIGSATAEKFAKDGAKVIVADIEENHGKKTAQSIQKSGGDAEFIKVDVSSYDSVESLVQETLLRHGKLDVMFNNAGIGNPQTSVLEMPIDEYLRTISVNQHGVFYGIRAAGRAMKDHGGGGVIINTASIYAYMADRKQFPYHASKGAVVSMTKAAALELARYNIRVVAIAPGLIDTNIIAAWKENPGVWRAIERAQMRGKAGKPEDVANVVVFLASEEASFVNGNVFFVDDGASSFKR